MILQVMELLYRQKWGLLDGLGALIISPTRELALQIFNELRKVGKYHDLSAGLLVGGNNVKEERDRIGGTISSDLLCEFNLLLSFLSCKHVVNVVIISDNQGRLTLHSTFSSSVKAKW